MRATPLDRFVTCVIGLLGLAVFGACGGVLWHSHQLFVADNALLQAMGISQLIVASGIMFAGMTLVLRLRSSREDHPPRLGPAVLIIFLGGLLSLGAVYLGGHGAPAQPSPAASSSAAILAGR
jgi:hypothetical protein